MANILVSRAGLIQALEKWLVRSDMADDAPTLIAMAEARLKRDHRVRRFRRIAEFEIDSAVVDLPEDFKHMDSLTYLGVPGRAALQNKSMEEVARRWRQRPEGGFPQAYAIGDGTLHIGPEPNETYTLELTYWGDLHPQLSETDLQNWLLESHPDIYLYSALIEAAPYLKDDARLETWHTLRDAALEELHRLNSEQRYSGNLSRPAPNPIG